MVRCSSFSSFEHVRKIANKIRVISSDYLLDQFLLMHVIDIEVTQLVM